MHMSSLAMEGARRIHGRFFWSVCDPAEHAQGIAVGGATASDAYERVNHAVSLATWALVDATSVHAMSANATEEWLP
jgi:hypothetical protein